MISDYAFFLILYGSMPIIAWATYCAIHGYMRQVRTECGCISCVRILEDYDT